MCLWWVGLCVCVCAAQRIRSIVCRRRRRSKGRRSNMNLFCFSLEASNDSLYEPNPSRTCIRDLIPARTRSPSLQRNKDKWRGSDPCLSSKQPQAQAANSRKKQRRPKSKTPERTSVNLPSRVPTLENEKTEPRDPLSWQPSRDKSDSVFNRNHNNKETGTDSSQHRLLSGEDREEQLNLERREIDPLTQGVNFEAWKPNYEHADCHQPDPTGDAEEELRGTLKRIQRLVKVKKGSGAEDGKTPSGSSGHLVDNVFQEDNPVITCIGLSKKTDKKTVKAASPPRRHPDKENSGGAGEGRWALGGHAHPWSPTEVPPPWDSSYHTCPRLQMEHRGHGFDFTLPRAPDWERFESLVQELDSKQAELASPPRVIRSITDVDISDVMRSSANGRFNDPTPLASPAKPPSGETLSTGREPVGSEETSSGSLGRRIKAASHTVCKRMGKNHVKVPSGETVSEKDNRKLSSTSSQTQTMTGLRTKSCASSHCSLLHRPHNKTQRQLKERSRKKSAEGRGGGDGGRPGANSRWVSSNSLGSLYSLTSGQSSSSGVTSGSDGFSNRDSLRLDEDHSYLGQICGRARVHTDFDPSPYDDESLKLKVGDTIDIISKPPMGTWTGVLKGKVGNFKFVYVDVLVDKEPEMIQKMRRSRRDPPPQPRTLHELLTRLHLEEYISPLLLNGYHTVEDLRRLQDRNLIELNVTDPEHRHRLLAAFECLQEPQWDNQKGGGPNQDAGSPTESIKTRLKEHPRDSGCYMPSDCCDAEHTALTDGYPALTVS